MTSNTKLSIWVLAAIVWAAALATDAQTVPPCASNLAACFPYMNATKPPAKCCIPLKVAIDTQFKCLCNLYQSPEFAASGVNVTEALTLPARCGISKDLSACEPGISPAPAQSPGSSTTPAGTSPAPAQSPGSSTTPAGVPPPAPGTDDKKNGAGKTALAKGFFAAIIFWGLIKLY